jgi:hypothetical protein
MSGSMLTWFLTNVLGQTPSVQQTSLIRKLIYIGLILALFTASYFYRVYAAEPQAQALAVRDRDVGDPDLTGAAMRLGLTGFRGGATCFVWINAIDKQKKGQWQELDLLVTTATKLQPHFNTPWQFQSWNLAFNVSIAAISPATSIISSPVEFSSSRTANARTGMIPNCASTSASTIRCALAVGNTRR